MKKKLSVIAFLLAFAMLLCSCGPNSATQQTPSPENSQDTPADPAASSGWKPTANINGIVPFAAGGGTDLNMRVISMYAKEYLGADMFITNMGGSGGLIGYTAIANSEADGSVMGIFAFPGAANASMTENEFTVDRIRYLFCQVIEPKFVAVAAGSGFNTMQELIDYAKANPGSLVACNNGAGSSNQIAMYSLSCYGGLDFTHTGYDGAAEMKIAVMGGEADLMPVGRTEIDESLKPLMVFGKERHADFPDVPCSYELGIECDVTAHRIIGVPADTPDEVFDYLMEGFSKMVEDPGYQEALAQTGSQGAFITGSELQDIIDYHMDFLTEYNAMCAERGLE